MQYSGRSGCAFTPAFGREERRFRGGFLERPKAEALGYLEASATTTATAKGVQLQQQRRVQLQQQRRVQLQRQLQLQKLAG